MRGAWLIALAVLAARPAAADMIVIDLGSDDTLTVPVAPGPLRIFIRNRLPRMNYDVVVRREIIPVDPFPRVDLSGLASGGDCAAVLSLVGEIEKSPDERKVAEVTAKIRDQMGTAQCTAAELKTVEEGLARTESEVGTYPVSAGEQLTIAVTRGDGKKKWTRVASAGARGVWHTSYGAATVPDRDERFFVRSKDNGKFEIVREQDRDSLKVIPSVFFTWLPASRQLHDLSWGPTAGLGVKADRPAVFAGWTFTYNWNLGFTLGGGLVSESRLSGRYTADPPQELAQTVGDDQLHARLYRVRWMAAVTFRFGSNPLEGGTPAAPPEKKPEKKPEK